MQEEIALGEGSLVRISSRKTVDVDLHTKEEIGLFDLGLQPFDLLLGTTEEDRNPRIFEEHRISEIRRRGEANRNLLPFELFGLGAQTI